MMSVFCALFRSNYDFVVDLLIFTEITFFVATLFSLGITKNLL